jgi:GH25 family lysozyme M1 (1,4-beta-N-acetylmuramidase)
MIDHGRYHAPEAQIEAHLHQHQHERKDDADQGGDKNGADRERDFVTPALKQATYLTRAVNTSMACCRFVTDRVEGSLP